MPKKAIVCIGRIDTKGEITRYLKDRIEHAGLQCLVMDIGFTVDPQFTPDITRAEVAAAAGTTWENVRAMSAEGKQMASMAEGARNIVSRLHADGKLDGLVSLGGGMTTAAATSAMRALPVGVPKLMVSSKIAQSGCKYYMGAKDVTMMPSVFDISAVSSFSRRIIDNAAAAIVGMANNPGDWAEPDKPVIVMSRLGDTTSCEENIRRLFRDKEYEFVVFHSVGPGGRAMEEFISTNKVDGVIEVGMNEIGNNLFGGMADAGPGRLESAGELGITQVITLGGIEFINFQDKGSIPVRLRKRLFNFHNPQATTMRLNQEEMLILAETLAGKLNRSKGPVEVLIPMRGFSELNHVGGIFYDPDTDMRFMDRLIEMLDDRVVVRKIDSHIADPEFALAVVEDYRKMSSAREPSDPV